MNDIDLGEYVLRNDVIVGDMISTGTAPKGTRFNVDQVDVEGRKVLVRFGEKSLHWFSRFWLAGNADKVTSQ